MAVSNRDQVGLDRENMEGGTDKNVMEFALEDDHDAEKVLD